MAGNSKDSKILSYKDTISPQWDAETGCSVPVPKVQLPVLWYILWLRWQKRMI